MGCAKARLDRLLHIAALGVVGAVLLIVGGRSPASATAGMLAPSPSTPWAQPNGRVLAIARVNGVVYIGGKFTDVTDSDGVTVFPRNHLAAISAADGHVLPWDPGANGMVRSLAVSTDGTTIYIGGDFTTLGGRPRTRLAAEAATNVTTSSSGVLRAWAPRADRPVYTLIPLNGRIYLGGAFRHINGALRLRLAAVSAGPGRVAPWSPTADGAVRTLLASPTGTTIFTGGDFQKINGHATGHLTAIDPTSGRRQPWRSRATSNVLALADNSSTLFAGDSGGGGHLRAYALASGRMRWTNTSDGNVTSVAMFGSGSGQRVVVGGHFNLFGKYTRHKIAAIIPTTGLVDPSWSPYASGSILGVFSILAYGQYAYVGGDFTRWSNTGMGTVDQAHLADFPSTAPADTTPPVVSIPLVSFQAGTTLGPAKLPIVVRWSASDPASGVCRYHVQRDFNAGPYKPIPLRYATVQAVETPVTPALPPYSFRVQATDCSDNSSQFRLSAPVRVTAFKDLNRSIAYRGPWRTTQLRGAYGGSVRRSAAAGATASLHFTGRAIAWVGSMGPRQGGAQVSIDGARVATIRSHAPGIGRRRVLFTHRWAVDGKHTIRITVLGTRGHPLVDIDAFLSLR